jgi:hypothetical protein
MSDTKGPEGAKGRKGGKPSRAKKSPKAPEPVSPAKLEAAESALPAAIDPPVGATPDEVAPQVAVVPDEIVPQAEVASEAEANSAPALIAADPIGPLEEAASHEQYVAVPEEPDPPSYAPIVTGLGIAVTAWGFLTDLSILGLGILVFCFGMSIWIKELTHHEP